MTAEGVSFRRFVRSVRRFGPSALLPEVAKIGAEQSLRHREGAHHYYDGRSGVTPWALAAIAHESLSATERGRLASQDDVRRLCNLYANLEDPISESTDSSVDQFFVRLGFEQFRWQISEFEELSRSRALLVEAAAQVPGADLLSEETWQERLGCSVAEFVSIGFFLYVWAAQHEGVVDLSFMDLPHFAPVLERHPRDRVELLLGTRLAATIPELRDLESPRIVEENVADTGPITALRRRIPGPADVDGLHSARTATCAPFTRGVLPRPQISRESLLACWRDEAALGGFLADHPTGRDFASGWHVRMELIRSAGIWPGTDLDLAAEAGSKVRTSTGPTVAITIGTAYLKSIVAFTRVNNGLEDQFLDTPSGIWGTLMTNLPQRLVATLTIWEDADAAFAYVRAGAHGAAVAAHYDPEKDPTGHTFVTGGGFFGFKPLSMHGSVGGKNAIAADVLAKR